MFSSLFGRQGDKGDKGDTGEQGEQGIQGIQGEQGEQGEQGTAAYTDRGNMSSADFDHGDLTKDAGWHELDLSGIIPEGTKLVVLNVLARDTASTNFGKLSTNGSSSGYNAINVYTTSTSDYTCIHATIKPTADRKIQYQLMPGTWNMFQINIVGWFV